jgi:hypothetical protein
MVIHSLIIETMKFIEMVVALDKSHKTVLVICAYNTRENAHANYYAIPDFFQVIC